MASSSKTRAIEPNTLWWLSGKVVPPAAYLQFMGSIGFDGQEENESSVPTKVS